MSRSISQRPDETRSLIYAPRVLGLLASVLAWGLALTPVHSEPTSPETRDVRIDITVRQVNALLAEHPDFTAPFGFAVTTLVVDGRYFVKEFGDPTVAAGTEDWMADVNDLRAEVKERVFEGHRPLYDIQCRAEGPLRPERMNRCWWLGDRADTLVPDGDLWHQAGPVASRAISDGIEDLIALLHARELAPR